MNHLVIVMLCNLDSGMLSAGCCTADQQRNGKTLALHFLGDVHHFVKRWRYQTG